MDCVFEATGFLFLVLWRISIEIFLLLCGKQEVKSIALVECQHFWRVYGINYHKPASEFVLVISEPFFHKIKHLTTYSLACEFLIDTNTTYQDAWVAIEPLLMMGSA